MDPGWISAFTALALAVFGCAGWVTRRAWRLLRGTAHFLDDWKGEPARDGLPARPGFMARLTAVEESIEHIRAETQPNHGKSLRDVVHRTAEDVAAIKADQAAIREWMDRPGSHQPGYGEDV